MGCPGSMFPEKLLSDRTHSKISEYFPGCSSKILQVQWSRRLKGLCDTFTAKEVISPAAPSSTHL